MKLTMKLTICKCSFVLLMHGAYGTNKEQILPAAHSVKSLRGMTMGTPKYEVGQPSNKRARALSGCSVKKDIQITKFCINGNADLGSHGEHQLRMNGERYYPNDSYDCLQETPDFCKWKEEQCHTLTNAPVLQSEAGVGLTVGTEEYDKYSSNDSTTAILDAEKWYIPTCDTYEIKVAQSFDPITPTSICWNHTDPNTNSTESETESCVSWGEPWGSYIWFLKVMPAKEYDQLRYSSDDSYCITIRGGNASNGNVLVLSECQESDAQLWKIDTKGYIRSKANPDKCIDPKGPSTAVGTPLQLWDCPCNDYVTQQWQRTEEELIRSEWDLDVCIGVEEGKVSEQPLVTMQECNEAQSWEYNL